MAQPIFIVVLCARKHLNLGPKIQSSILIKAKITGHASEVLGIMKKQFTKVQMAKVLRVF